MKEYKKTKSWIIWCIALVAVILTILLQVFSIEFALLIKGYDPFDYDVYKISDSQIIDTKSKATDGKIIKVNRENEFNYVIIGKNRFGIWHITHEGEYSESGLAYSTLSWMEGVIINTEDDFTLDYRQHKLIELIKADSDVAFEFEKLPEDIVYTFSDNENTYITEIFEDSTSELAGRTNLSKFDIWDIIDFDSK